jgi:hypothetical protein
MDELERAITEAHESGDRALLERLQAEYRTRDTYRPGPPPQLWEGSATEVVSPARHNGSSRSTLAPGTVALSPYAKRSISGFWRGDAGMETGGFLWGWVAHDVVLIDSAVEAGEGMERGPTHTRYDSEYVETYEYGVGRPIIGDWHTHPGQPDPEPSAADRKCWAKHAGRAGIPWASVILGDDGVSPYWPMRAFVTLFRGGNSQTYPARLVEEEPAWQ